jgi:hypothetical protein
VTEDQLILWTEKISELDRKLSQLINQNDERFYDEKSGPDNEPPRLPENKQVEVIFRELKEALEGCSNKRAQNLTKNGMKLEQIRLNLQTIFSEAATKNSTRADDLPVHRKERRFVENTNLINEILTMVKNRMRLREDSARNISEAPGSMTSMVSSFENMKSSTVLRRIKTTLPPRKDRIIFPNVKNKPSKINTTFTSESFDIKEIKVRFIEIRR